MKDQQRLRAICESSPDSIVVADSDGEITYVNARVRDMLGYEPHELVGERVERLVPVSARESHVIQRETYMEDPKTRPMGLGLDLEARKKDGSTLPVAISLSPLRTDAGPEVMATIRDISDRKGLQRKFKAILEAMPDALLIAETTNGEIVEANGRITELLGYEPDELIGKPQTVVHPAGERDRYRDLFENHVSEGDAIFDQFPDGSNICVETVDDERIPVEINAGTFEFDGNRLIIGVFRDISSRIERENRLKELHETNRDLMMAESRQEVATITAEAAKSILGFKSTVVRFASDDALQCVAVTEKARMDMGERPQYPLAGDSPVSAVYQSSEAMYVEDVRELDDGYDRGDTRAAMYVPVGEAGVLSIGDTAIDAFGRSDREIATILATTAETALTRLEYERELERQNKQLDEFASIVSHDLRNPLTVARGWLDLVDEREAEIERIEESLNRMEGIIEDTLELARQGGTVSELESLDIGSLAEDCWGVVSTADAQIRVREPVQIRSDRDRLKRLFENLFRNAIEHGGENVTVSIGRCEGGFYVEDDGSGIPPDKRDRVLEPGHTTIDEGTGLGLTIVREIAEAHGWGIQITDSESGGARFEFTDVDRG